MHLGEVATQPVATIPADARPWEAAERMRLEAVGSLVVVDADGRAVGMLTDRDLALRVVAMGTVREEARVADLMSAPLLALDPGQDLEAAARLMRARGVRRIPLLEEGRPVGLVSLDDLLRTLARELLDLGEEALSARTHALSEARGKGPLQEIQDLARQAHARLGRAKYMAQEALMDELDGVRERLRRALEGL